MAIYIYTPDSDTYDSLVLAKVRDYEKTNEFIGAVLAHDWQPIAARIYKGQKRGDFPSLTSHVPVFSKRALNALLPLLAQTVEVLPLKVKGGEFFAVNALQITDCLDSARSDVKLDSDGEVMYIAHYAFDERCLHGKHMFKIRQAPLMSVLVSEEFRQRVEEEGLQGLIFRQVG